MTKIFQRLERGSSMTTGTLQKNLGLKAFLARAVKHAWVAASADPAVDAGSQGTYPVSVGDFAYRVDTDEAFICSVAPTANTAATFIQLHA